jgi:hypothetical protein
MSKCARVVEGNNHAKIAISKCKTDDAYGDSNHYCNVLKSNGIQTINENYGKSTQHLHKHSVCMVLKSKQCFE